MVDETRHKYRVRPLTVNDSNVQPLMTPDFDYSPIGETGVISHIEDWLSELAKANKEWSKENGD